MAKELNLSEGGANHQKPKGDDDVMTTAQGHPIADDQNWLTAGPRGPQLLEDQIAREKIFHFDHERIPERVVHARGFGAHGFFELMDDLSDVSCARILTEVGEKTPAFVRFSTVAGNKGSPDLARDVRDVVELARGGLGARARGGRGVRRSVVGLARRRHLLDLGERARRDLLPVGLERVGLERVDLVLVLRPAALHVSEEGGSGPTGA